MAQPKNEPDLGTDIERKPMALEEILRIIRTGVGEIVISDDEIQEQMLKRDLMAQSWEELLTPPTLVKAELYINRTVLFKSIRFNNSKFEEGSGIYGVVEISDGENDVMLSCGMASVMEKLFIAQSRGWLPAEARIVQATKRTKAGYLPFDLVLGPEPEEAF